MMTSAELIAFENRIRAHWQAGELPCLLHLCGGNEEQLTKGMFGQCYEEGDWVLSGHRNHYHALLAGIPPDELEASILAGRSMFTASRARRFLSSAILAGLCGVANGIAWALREDKEVSTVWCFVGDGAEEEGHFYEAAMFAQTHRLPVWFIIEDNDRQVDTPRLERRPGFTRTLDEIFSLVIDRYGYAPTYPHAGDGSKPGAITFKPEAVERLRKLTGGA